MNNKPNRSSLGGHKWSTLGGHQGTERTSQERGDHQFF